MSRRAPPRKRETAKSRGILLRRSRYARVLMARLEFLSREISVVSNRKRNSQRVAGIAIYLPVGKIHLAAILPQCDTPFAILAEIRVARELSLK